MIIGIITSLIFLAFSCKWIIDTLLFHYEGSFWSKLKNQSYFDPAISWANKYKYDLLSNSNFKKWIYKNMLVFLTDFFHLIQFIELNSIILALSIALYGISDYRGVIVVFLGLRLLYSICGIIWYKNR